MSTIQTLIKQWERRKISVLGKITVAKTLLIPVLTHLFIAIPNPDASFIKRIEVLLFQYIWNGRDRISRDQMVKNNSYGGCNMVHLDSFISSLKITWIRRLINNDSAWKNHILSSLNIDCESFFKFGDNFFAELACKTKNKFWRHVF